MAELENGFDPTAGENEDANNETSNEGTNAAGGDTSSSGGDSGNTSDSGNSGNEAGDVMPDLGGGMNNQDPPTVKDGNVSLEAEGLENPMEVEEGGVQEEVQTEEVPPTSTVAEAEADADAAANSNSESSAEANTTVENENVNENNQNQGQQQGQDQNQSSENTNTNTNETNVTVDNTTTVNVTIEQQQSKYMTGLVPDGNGGFIVMFSDGSQMVIPATEPQIINNIYNIYNIDNSVDNSVNNSVEIGDNNEITADEFFKNVVGEDSSIEVGEDGNIVLLDGDGNTIGDMTNADGNTISIGDTITINDPVIPNEDEPQEGEPTDGGAGVEDGETPSTEEGEPDDEKGGTEPTDNGDKDNTEPTGNGDKDGGEDDKGEPDTNPDTTPPDDGEKKDDSKPTVEDDKDDTDKIDDVPDKKSTKTSTATIDNGIDSSSVEVSEPAVASATPVTKSMTRVHKEVTHDEVNSEEHNFFQGLMNMAHEKLGLNVAWMAERYGWTEKLHSWGYSIPGYEGPADAYGGPYHADDYKMGEYKDEYDFSMQVYDESQALDGESVQQEVVTEEMTSEGVETESSKHSEVFAAGESTMDASMESTITGFDGKQISMAEFESQLDTRLDYMYSTASENASVNMSADEQRAAQANRDNFTQWYNGLSESEQQMVAAHSAEWGQKKAQELTASDAFNQYSKLSDEAKAEFNTVTQNGFENMQRDPSGGAANAFLNGYKTDVVQQHQQMLQNLGVNVTATMNSLQSYAGNKESTAAFMESQSQVTSEYSSQAGAYYEEYAERAKQEAMEKAQAEVKESSTGLSYAEMKAEQGKQEGMAKAQEAAANRGATVDSDLGLQVTDFDQTKVFDDSQLGG